MDRKVIEGFIKTVVIIIGVVGITYIGTIAYVAFHFISKFW